MAAGSGGVEPQLASFSLLLASLPLCASSTLRRPPAASAWAQAETHFADEVVRGLERAKWRLWHGLWTGYRRKLAALCRWAWRKHVQDVAGIGRLEPHVSELLGYLERNQSALVHYAARRRHGASISTAFVESTVSEIVAERMNTQQWMRWSRATVQPFLYVRTTVPHDALEDVFRSRHSGLRPADDDEVTATAA